MDRRVSRIAAEPSNAPDRDRALTNGSHSTRRVIFNVRLTPHAFDARSRVASGTLRVPIYHHFHFERRGPDGWTVPADFVPAPHGFSGEPFRSYGEFAFAHPRARWLELFYDTDALFPLRPGAPDDRRGSPLLAYLDQYGDYLPEDVQLHWLPYSELLIDCWDRDKLLVGAKLPARYAMLFGDGRQAFPSENLSRAGFDTNDWQFACRVGRCNDPIDYTFGRNRFELADLPPDYEITMTWHATIEEYIGGWSAEFKRLRMYGHDEELRILVTRG